MLAKDANNTCANDQDVSLRNVVDNWTFVRITLKHSAVPRNYRVSV